jgi:hypothetical protein
MNVSAHNVVATGDVENDLPMLAMCECGVAVNNALESAKNNADIVTRADHGAGIEELIQGLLRDDLDSQLPPSNTAACSSARGKANRSEMLSRLALVTRF